MTTLDIAVIIIGLLGTLLLGSVAYKKWVSSNHGRRRRHVKTAEDARSPEKRSGSDSRPRRKDGMGGGYLLLIILIVIVVVGIGVYRYRHEQPKQETSQDLDFSHLDTIFMKVAREGKPAWVVIPQGWHIEWTEDDTKFSSQAIWQGQNKVRVFITKPGVRSVEIPIRRWYEPAKRHR